jgi:hypothetical protein
MLERICQYLESQCRQENPTQTCIGATKFLDLTSKPQNQIIRSSRICRYLRLKCSHNLNFFSLPSKIRQRVYLYAEITGNATWFCDCNIDKDQYYGGWHNPAKSLMLTCRAVYAEVSPIFYSSNRFIFQNKHFESLQHLRNLTPKTLSSLTHLNVQLHICWRGFKGCVLCCYFPEHHPRAALTIAQAKHRRILDEWGVTARYLFQHVQQSSLRIFLTCEVEELEAALQAVEPFKGTLFKACSIRLGTQKQPHLKDLARKVSKEAMGYIELFTTPFRMLDLPIEVRHQILEYTDLVTPILEVEWNQIDRYSVRYGKGFYCSKEEVHHYPQEWEHTGQIRDCMAQDDSGCYCMRYHASYSPTCHCWAPPNSLFLVCRSLRDDCIAVFFKRNRFIITHPRPPHEQADTRLDASVFLTDVVPSMAFRHIRFLEVVFPHFPPQVIFHNSPRVLSDWEHVLRSRAEFLSSPKLTIRLYFPNHLDQRSRQYVAILKDDCESFMHHFNDTARNWIERMQHGGKDTEHGKMLFYIRMCGALIKPISFIKALSNCFVHINGWACRLHLWYNEMLCEGPKITTRPQGIELRLEQLVMGKDYSGSLKDKVELRDSQWLQNTIFRTAYE